MKNFIKEFKDFAIRGNVIDLAVAVVIGTAFGNITTSLVNNVIMPLFGILLGGINFKDKSVTVGDAVVAYGAFIQSILEFVIIAFAIFLLIKIIRTVKERIERNDGVVADKPSPLPSEEVLLLREIRDSVKN
jgi:large conductance mechanosensitive channel